MRSQISKAILLLTIVLLPLFGHAQAFRKYERKKDKVLITLSEGILQIYPLNDNTFRVKFAKSENFQSAELVFTSTVKTPDFKVIDSPHSLNISLQKIVAVVDKKTSSLKFKDAQGKLILSEEVGGRSLTASTVQGEPTLIARQKFVSPKDEYLFGTGQFQDGFMNIKGLTRRLTQVNTQISIPFIYSSKGYGLLWHNYGLTDYNPANTKVELTPVSSTGEAIAFDVTTTEGTKKDIRQQAGFGGKFRVEKKGRYAVLLDVGQKMARKHIVSIDNKDVINFTGGYWMTPTASAFVDLDAGEHSVLISGDKKDRPSFYLRLTSDETVFQSPVSEGIDYVVFAGKADDVIASYRRLSGTAPLMPIWSLGYIHCRERFSTQKQILDNTNEFRNRKLPMDMIVQDWQYWGKYGWNAMKFDEKDYPDPAKMVDSLHSLNTRLMVSVWSRIDPKCEVGKEMTEKNYYIPNTQWVDFFNPDAAACYWRNFSSRLLKPYKIDAWWQDATEPENDDLVGRKIANGTILGEKLRNVYPLFVNKTVYEGSRRDVPEKRVCILTRSAFSGEQRYAAATWSGDIGHDWETFRRQIPAGLNYVITGLPYWTTDCGGFFRPANQYTDSTYHERFLRWFQYATFCPLQRVHGYKTDTEFWRFGPKVEKEAMRYLNLRYSLLPYIYSQAAAVTFSGSTLMRPLVMDFASDKKALEQNYEFMFGPSILVSPVLKPNVTKWDVYLPENKAGWYDFWSGENKSGGQTVRAEATIDKIPLFVKAGSIIPFGETKQNTTEKDKTIELRVYTGANAEFELYNDDGESYQYEKGECSRIKMEWNEEKKELQIADRKGKYKGMVDNIRFNVRWISPTNASGSSENSITKSIDYDGHGLKIGLPSILK